MEVEGANGLADVTTFLELFALCGLLIAEPLLGILRKGSGNLVSFVLGRLDLTVLVAAILFGPAGSLTLILVLANETSPRYSDGFRALVFAVLLGLFSIPVTKHATEWAARSVTNACVATVLLSWPVLHRWPGTSHLLLPVAVVPVLVGAQFLRDSSTRRVVLGKREAAPAVAASGERPRVVMVVFDELPTASLLDGDGGVDAALFPNFAELADTATWFRNVTTVAEHTHRAVPAILTGLYPTAGLLPSYRDHPRNLFTLLEAAGYRLNSFETLTQLSPVHHRRRWTTGWAPAVVQCVKLWQTYVSPRRGTREWFGDTREFSDALDIGKRFVASLESSRGPVFDFLHILVPHRPWHYAGAGLRYPKRKGDNVAPPTWESEAAMESARQRHLLQVQAADWLLGSIVERLKQIGAYDDALLVVTSDHGIAFTVGCSARSFAEETAEELLWVPLLVKGPGQRVRSVDDRPLRTVDIVPTVVDCLGLPAPWHLDGTSAFGEPRTDTTVGRVMFEDAEHGLDEMAGAWRKAFDGPSGFRRMLGHGPTSICERADLALFGMGPYGHLVGRAVADLAVATRPGPCGKFLEPRDFKRVELDAKVLPWMSVVGTLSEVGGGAGVAIAVNGRIAGVGRIEMRGEAGGGYSVMIAPALLARGANEVRAFVVEGEPGSPVLVPVTLE